MIYTILSNGDGFVASTGQYEAGATGSEDEQEIPISIQKSRKNANRPRRKHESHTVTVDDLPIYYQKAYMGSAFVAEFVAVVYRTRTFTLRHQAELPDFLSNDIFGTGCTPKDHFASLCIRVTLSRWSAKDGKDVQWTSSTYPQPYKQHFMKAIKPLNTLLDIAPKQGAKIRLSFDELWGWYRRPRRVTKLVASLVPWVYDMKDKGWDVSTTAVKANNINQMISYNYDISRLEWEKKIQTDEMFVSPHSAQFSLPKLTCTVIRGRS